MRRKDKEIVDKEIMESIVQKAIVCRIALSDNNMPYLIPVNFGYKDNVLYFHSATEGKKIEILKKNNKVCIEVDINHKIIAHEKPCSFGMRYNSVIGFGTASFIDDMEKKKDALGIIMDHYAPGKNFEFRERMLNRIVVIQIKIDSMTGKKSGD